jgi:hypothetical protein
MTDGTAETFVVSVIGSSGPKKRSFLGEVQTHHIDVHIDKAI